MSTKTGRRAAVPDGVRRGDERVADGDDLVARADADGQKRQVQRRRAVRDGAGVRRADVVGELALEGGDLRSLGHPAGQDHATHGLDFLLVENRLGDRNLLKCLRHQGYACTVERSACHHATSDRSPSSS